MFNINSIRGEYIYSLFINNKHLILDWPRQTGKSIYSLYCIFDYAINNQNSKNIVIGYDNALINLNQKLIRSNKNKLHLIKKHTSSKIELINGSIIVFNNDIRGEFYDTILIDEQGYTKINPFNFLSCNSKIIVNGTSTDSKVFDNFIKEFSKIGHINKYKSNEEISNYLRLKKIEKIKEKLSKSSNFKFI